jgi:hypothetical protein
MICSRFAAKSGSRRAFMNRSYAAKFPSFIDRVFQSAARQESPFANNI